MRKYRTIALLFLLLAIPAAALYFYLPSAATQALPWILSQFGIRTESVFVRSVTPWKIKLGPFSHCYDTQTSALCLSAADGTIDYDWSIVQRTIQAQEIVLTDAIVSFNTLLPNNPAENSEIPSSLPKLPFNPPPVQKISFLRKDSGAPPPLSPHILPLKGIVERIPGGTSIQLEGSTSLGSLELTAQSTETMPLVISFVFNKQIKIDLHVKDNAWHMGDVTVTTKDITGSKNPVFWPILFGFDGNTINASWNVSEKGQIDLSGHALIHDAKSTAHNFDWKTSVIINEKVTTAFDAKHLESGLLLNAKLDMQRNFAIGSSEYSVKIGSYPFSLSKLPLVPIPSISIDGGEVSTLGRIRWGPNYSSSLSAQIKNVNFNFAGCVVSGAYGSLTVLGQKSDNDSLHISTVQCGLELKNITSQLRMAFPHVEVNNLRAELLEGFVNVPQVVLGTKEFKVPVSITGVSLKAVTELYKQEQIDAQGAITITAPVTISANGAEIQDGKIQSEGPGWIRYNDQVSFEENKNPTLDITERALKNYEFTSLDGEFQYEPQGDLKIAVHLKGTSPALNTTRPVHVNLALEENLMSLFKSLKIADDIEHELAGLW